jgi:outer membrane protein W
MIRKTILTTAAVALVAVTASAQDSRVELSATAGWTFSDGVSGDSVTVPGVGSFNRIDPKDAFSWGARLGFLLNENSEVGFLFNQQSTQLEVGGSSTFDLGDETIYNYHGYYAYNFGDRDAGVRPYVLIGLGATQFGAVKVNVAGTERDIDGSTKFSGTAAVGVKIFPSPRFGIRLEGRWTPTYIKSDATGWWCDPYWGCYVVGDAQYANQFEMSGGIMLRF